MRRTKADVLSVAVRINHVLRKHGYNTFIQAIWIHKQFHIAEYNRNTGSTKGWLALRLSTKEAHQWLTAYLEGLKMGLLD